MIRLTDVVRHLLIINVIVFLASYLLWGSSELLAMAYPTSSFFKPYQIVTHMFAHADFIHIAFNMFVLAIFGPTMEAIWGEKRFLFYYLFCGFGALGLDVFVQYYTGSPHFVLGASGAIAGLIIAYAYLFPENKISLLFPPVTLPAKYMALIFVGFDLIMGFSGAQDGIAHFAHLGGALFGFLLLLFWQKFGSRL